MFYLDFETLNSPKLQAWYLSSWCLPKPSNVWGKFDCQIFVFSAHQNLDSPEIPKYAITFDSSRHSKSSLSITTDFISSAKVTIEKFLLLRSISGNDYRFRSLRWACDSPKMSNSFFWYRVLSIFQPGFRSQLLTWSLLPKARSIASKSSWNKWLGNLWVFTPLWNSDGPKFPGSAFSLGIPRY